MTAQIGWLQLSFAVLLSLASPLTAQEDRDRAVRVDGEGWTPWLNRDAPGGSGDFETLAEFVTSGQACAAPLAIECQTADGRDWTRAGQVYTCEPARGGICANADQRQGSRCLDYKVRFRCPPAASGGRQDGFRERFHNMRPLLDAARAGEQMPLDRKQVLRWYDTWLPRISGEGTFADYPAALLQWATGEASRFTRWAPQTAALCDKCSIQPRWAYRGPDGLRTQNQGIVDAIWVAPDDPKRILAGAGNGLWATTDGGATWNILTGGSKAARLLGVRDIAVNPNNRNDIFIATGLGLSFSDLGRDYGFGVFRSRTGGQTWAPVNLGNLQEKRFPAAHRIVFHPQNPRILYAALGPEVFKSVDGGASWSLLFDTSAGGVPLTVRDLAIRAVAGASDEVFVTTASRRGEEKYGAPAVCSSADPWTFVIATAARDYCQLRHTARVWKLTTGPLQTTLTGPPVDLTSLIAGYDTTTTLTAVEITARGAVIAAHFEKLGETGTQGVAFYKESGGAWTKTVSTLETGVNYGYTLVFGVSGNNPDVIYLSGLLMMKSTDGGATFKTMGQGYWHFLSDPRWAGSHPDVRALVVYDHGPQGDVVYFGTDGGISRTADGLRSTENLNGDGLRLSEVQGVGISESRPGLLVFGTMHNGFFTNRDHTWACEPGGDFYDAVVFDSAPGQVTALTTRNVAAWTYTAGDAGLPLSSGACPEKDCQNAKFVTSAGHIYIGLRSVYRRPAGGGAWTTVAALPCRASGLASSADGKILYAACPGPLWSGADASTFKGIVFRIGAPGSASPAVSDITRGLTAVAWRAVTDIATNEDGSVAWISSGGFGDTGVFQYRHTEGSWTRVGDGLPAIPTNALAWDADGRTLFAGTDVGVFAKPPNSNSWVGFSDAEPFTLVSDLELDPRIRTLYAATAGHGVWSTVLPPARALRNFCTSPVHDPADPWKDTRPDDFW